VVRVDTAAGSTAREARFREKERASGEGSGEDGKRIRAGGARSPAGVAPLFGIIAAEVKR
jgi:hypothetical protein